VLRTLGVAAYSDEQFAEWNDFSLAQATDDHPVTTRLHVGFAAASRQEVNAFWQAGIDAGFTDDGPPGLRPQYTEDYYGGFLRDPDGNSAEAVHYSYVREGGIDHLWIRVADVAASKRFYEEVARHAGFELRRDTPERVRFAGADRGGSFSLLPGDPTEHVHLAFPAPDDATVDAFHGALVEAGYRDNGAPDERPIYHPGYYGAFVLDPDGNNVELVNHNRG
jgi:catechol 2,3-dioxygenase-like lactoylglutathione lyase family enzyme